MSNHSETEILAEPEPLSRRSWSDPTYGLEDMYYERRIQDLAKLEINYLLSEGIDHPGEWVRLMNTPSYERHVQEPVLAVERRRKIGDWLRKRSFVVKTT